jgi:tetratricopeptide (TPR) repeat protein
LAPVGYWLVAPLGLAALILGAGGGRREVLLRGTAALLAAGTIVFHVADRYRLATVPALLVLAAGYARAIVLAWRRGDRPRALGRAGLAVAAALLVNVPDFYPGGQDTAPFDHVMAYGAAAQGDPAAAARWAERAAAQYYRRGRAALEAGELLRAGVYFERTLDARSDFPGAWYHLGVARERLGREAEAGRAYERAVATGSFAVEALTRLGRLHLAAGRTAEAETVLSTARERAPDSVAILVSLGDLWAAQGRFDEALALFEEARRIAGSEDWLDRRIAAARAGLTTEALPWR